jgi:hypothetical protein
MTSYSPDTETRVVERIRRTEYEPGQDAIEPDERQEIVTV